MRVRIAQCLCLSRHAILGMAVNDDTTTDEQIDAGLREVITACVYGDADMLRRLGLDIERINPRCGICGCRWELWRYEVRWSKEFDTWEQAQEVLKEFET